MKLCIIGHVWRRGGKEAFADGRRVVGRICHYRRRYGGEKGILCYGWTGQYLDAGAHCHG